MSIATITAVGIAAEGLTDSLAGVGASIGGAITAVAWPVASIVAAVEVGKGFGLIWNKNRSKLPELNIKLQNAQKEIADLGADVIQPALTNANAFITNSNNIHEMDLIHKILRIDIQTEIQNIIDDYKLFSDSLFNQYQEYVTTLALFYIAGNDNAFYTDNKNNLDALIDAYSTSTIDIDKLVQFGTVVDQTLKNLIDSIDEQYRRASFIVSVLLAPPTYTPLPNEAEKIRERVDEVTQEPVTIASLTRTLPTLDELAEYLKTKTATLTKTRTKTRERKKLRRKKRKIRKKKTKKKTPEMVKTMWIDTMNSSRWIKRVEFTFPSMQNIDSDAKGTLKFYLKKGGVIKKVRVKRGTFSTIAVWSIGTKLGVGYRYWSQFNKAAIVNKQVFSYSLKRINAQDREIAIPIEILEKRVKYR